MEISPLIQDITIGVAIGLILVLGPFGGIVLKRFFNRNGNGNGNGNGHVPDRRVESNGITVLEYLQQEIKPEILKLREDHTRLKVLVASMPTRDELTTKINEVQRRIDNHITKKE